MSGRIEAHERHIGKRYIDWSDDDWAKLLVTLEFWELTVPLLVIKAADFYMRGKKDCLRPSVVQNIMKTLCSPIEERIIARFDEILKEVYEGIKP